MPFQSREFVSLGFRRMASSYSRIASSQANVTRVYQAEDRVGKTIVRIDLNGT